MSANVPPPPGQNPYAPQPPQQAPQQPQSPYAASPYAGGPATPGTPGAPAGFNAYAPPGGMAPAGSKNAGLAVVLGIVAMVAGLFIYAGIMRAMAKDDGTITEIGYVALIVGALVGAVVGKVGGRHQVLPVVAALLSVLGVFLGEFVGYSMVASHAISVLGGDMSWFTILTDHTSEVWDAYKHDFDFMTFLFLAIAGFEGFAISRRVAG